MFFCDVEGHMPKLSSFGQGKTIQPNKSLTSFLHAALQLALMLMNNIFKGAGDNLPE